MEQPACAPRGVARPGGRDCDDWNVYPYLGAVGHFTTCRMYVRAATSPAQLLDILPQRLRPLFGARLSSLVAQEQGMLTRLLTSQDAMSRCLGS